MRESLFANLTVSRHRCRWTEYELDTDELSREDLAQLEVTQSQRPPRSSRARHRDQTVPLLVGLLDSASARRSVDGTLQLQHQGGDGDEDIDEVDLEALAAKRHAGGGMLDSVANMANSILGAGKYLWSMLLLY